MHRRPILLLLCASAFAGLPLALRALAAQSSSAPASRPAHFQPGVQIDWQLGLVRVAARVVLREGPLEFVACFAGKEHESILRIEARATHVYMALGLIGLTPGRPPQWDDAARRYHPPEGDLVDVTVEWTAADGQPRNAALHEWLTEVEYGRPPFARPWVFAGSRMLDGGVLLADRTGAGVAVVDMPDSLLAASRSRASRDAELWALARSEAIPPLDTPVTLTFRAAAPVAHRYAVDFRGAATVDGRYASPADFADLLAIELRLRPADRLKIELDGTLESDVAGLRARLTEAGVGVDRLRFARRR